MRIRFLALIMIWGLSPGFAWAAESYLDSDVDFEGLSDVDLEELIEEGGQAVLEYSDKAANPYPNRTFTVEMILEGGADDGQTLKMKMISKNGNRTALRFLEPADLQGLALVIKGAEQIYVKLPGTRKVRRVASHARKQSFQGTDWSMDDLRLLRLAPSFKAKIKEVTKTHVILDLKKKFQTDLPYSRIVVHLPKHHLVPEKLEYYDADGKKSKVQVRSEPRVKNGKISYLKNKMTDLIRNHSTSLVVLEESHKKIPMRTFTKRWLVRGT